MILGVGEGFCANAVVLAEGTVIPAAITAANCIIDLVNIFIFKKSGVSGKPSGKPRKRRLFLLLIDGDAENQRSRRWGR